MEGVMGERKRARKGAGVVQGGQWVRGSTFARWTLVLPGWLGTAAGVRVANMGAVNSERYAPISWHGLSCLAISYVGKLGGTIG